MLFQTETANLIPATLHDPALGFIPAPKIDTPPKKSASMTHPSGPVMLQETQIKTITDPHPIFAAGLLAPPQACVSMPQTSGPVKAQEVVMTEQSPVKRRIGITLVILRIKIFFARQLSLDLLVYSLLVSSQDPSS